MPAPEIPEDEGRRIAALRALGILDTPEEERFDRITRLARTLFRVPIALVSLVDSDRQWFKSHQGLDTGETPREISFCGHAILSDDILLVPDAYEDERFAENPWVRGEPHVRFYAGCPLMAPNGARLGTLCIIDHEPRTLREPELRCLEDLTSLVERELAAVELASEDGLTGLANRNAFESVAQDRFRIARRDHTPLTLALLDLDGFEAINDALGHQEGDLMLQQMAEALRGSFREADFVARLGGDEFVVLMGCEACEARTPLRRLKRSVAAINERRPPGFPLAYSVGFASLAADRHPRFADLLKEADERMVRAKSRRRQSRSGAGAPDGSAAP